MSIAAITSTAATSAPLALQARPVAEAAPAAIRTEPRSEPRADIAPVQAATAIASGAALAAQTAYDCRATGPAANVASFDRIAMIEEGFAHLRNILEGSRQQAEETFAGFKAMAIDAAMAESRLDVRA